VDIDISLPVMSTTVDSLASFMPSMEEITASIAELTSSMPSP
jgi:hypothetical protein